MLRRLLLGRGRGRGRRDEAAPDRGEPELRKQGKAVAWVAGFELLLHAIEGGLCGWRERAIGGQGGPLGPQQGLDLGQIGRGLAEEAVVATGPTTGVDVVGLEGQEVLHATLTVLGAAKL